MSLAGSATEWYAIRAGGLVAYLLLTACVLLGIVLGGRVRLERWPRFAVQDLHAFAGWLTGTFIVLHGSLLLVDDYMSFSLADVLVPGAADADALAMALGIVAAELLLALAVATRVRRRLGQRRWVVLHRLNAVVWGLALLHGAIMGTDRDAVWAVVLYAVTGAAVCGALAWRIVAPSAPRPAPAAGPPVVVAASPGLADGDRHEPWPGLFEDAATGR